MVVQIKWRHVETHLVKCLSVASFVTIFFLPGEAQYRNSPEITEPNLSPLPSDIASIRPARQGYFIHSETREIITFPIPGYAEIDTATIQHDNSVSYVSLKMQSTIPTVPEQRGRMIVEVWFQAPHSASYDRGIVYVAGDYEYLSTPPLRVNQAGLVDRDGTEVVVRTPVDVTLRGREIQFSVPRGWLEEFQPVVALVRYLPRTYDLEIVSGGLEVSLSSYVVLSSELRAYSFTLPSLPSSAEFFGADEFQRQRGPYGFVIPPSRRGRPFFDGNPRWRMPPDSDDNAHKREDINNDGTKDWDYPADTPVIGNVIIDMWGTTEPQDFVVVIGDDANDNGQLDPDEIWFPIGECPFPGGANTGIIAKDGTIQWVSFGDNNGNGKHDPGEPSKRFTYDPWNMELTVVSDPDGPGPARPREIYRGHPSGYDWHHQ